ncbi:MAG TPA: nucleotidyltransferase [Bacteroidia bacterium]|jgi:hypothetical protein|nr:nucleotidyltransferase [Bacteroidia bacterium]
MDLSQDFKEFVQLLNKNNVEYLVVGGYAVTAHGYPRYTGDIDFWIKPELENAHRVILALHEFGFGEVDITIEDLIVKDNVIQLGFPPNRIDILTSVSGVTFEECWKEKSEIMIDGEKIHFISLRHLRINKEKTGRTQDKLDLENLPE